MATHINKSLSHKYILNSPEMILWLVAFSPLHSTHKKMGRFQWWKSQFTTLLEWNKQLLKLENNLEMLFYLLCSFFFFLMGVNDYSAITLSFSTEYNIHIEDELQTFYHGSIWPKWRYFTEVFKVKVGGKPPRIKYREIRYNVQWSQLIFQIRKQTLELTC